jgi:hypothetical protein
MRIREAARWSTVIGVLGVVSVLAVSCSRPGSVFRQYEYEEEVYLSLDGSATVYVHSSIAALNALRGTSFDASPAAAIDRAGIRAFFSSPVTSVKWVRPSRRSGRRFAHVRLEVDDIRRLSDAPPFAWSTYDFRRDGELFVYRQTVGASAGKEVEQTGPARWNGREVVAFRLHLPSKIRFENSASGEGRGNILAWEQPLADRRSGVPLSLEARMDPQSILYRTLWLFGATFVAVAVLFALVIWWVLRRAPAITPSEGPNAV